jgi:hypothetical protein
MVALREAYFFDLVSFNIDYELAKVLFFLECLEGQFIPQDVCVDILQLNVYLTVFLELTMVLDCPSDYDRFNFSRIAFCIRITSGFLAGRASIGTFLRV